MIPIKFMYTLLNLFTLHVRMFYLRSWLSHNDFLRWKQMRRNLRWCIARRLNSRVGNIFIISIIVIFSLKDFLKVTSNYTNYESQLAIMVVFLTIGESGSPSHRHSSTTISGKLPVIPSYSPSHQPSSF